MAIMNRRNALLGWAVWSTTKRLAAHKAKRAVPSPAPPEKKKRRTAKTLAATLALAGAAVAIWSRQRGNGDASDPWPAETSEP
jgi:ferric-dicitrate binding protein FerR (iron transport regulator)